MNYGSLGFLSKTEEGRYEFAFSREIFSALCISHKSRLHGLYYPCPSDRNDPAYKETTIKHDFLITPIPPNLWKASARIHIFLKSTPGTINLLCAFLREKQISIVHSESTRSSYRYATWSLHIVFEKILKNEGDYKPEKGCYENTEDALEKLITALLTEEISEHLHIFKTEKRPAVTGHPNFGLAWFANYRDDLEKTGKKNHTPFTLKVNAPDKSGRKRRLQGDETLTRILDEIKPSIIPATTFTEIDTTELSLRTVPISKENAKRFFKVSIKYKCDISNKQADTYVGIMHDITSYMPPHYDIWHSYDRTIDNNPSERGEIVFLIEDTSIFLEQEGLRIKGRKDHRKGKGEKLEEDKRNAQSYIAEALNHFGAIVGYYHNNQKRDSSVDYDFEPPVISPLPTDRVMHEIFLEEDKGTEFEFDVFISYTHADTEFVKSKLSEVFEEFGIAYHLDYREIHSGDRLDDLLFANIKKSREMCVVLSEEAVKSQWMPIERGAAWILRKTITGIKTQISAAIPDVLGMNVYVNAYQGDEYDVPQNGDSDLERDTLKEDASKDDPVKEALKTYAEDILRRRDEYLGKMYSRNFLK